MNLICICGHIKDAHEPSNFKHLYPGEHFCEYCTSRGNRNWHDFKLSNLSLLEQKYEESLNK